MKNDIYLSVIIPAYNSEKYIANCIESILELSNIELIIINDGSTDNTLRICNKYTENENLYIISIENQGVSNARNIGIAHARGKFITFVDSDDTIIAAEYSKMLKLLSEKYKDYDIVEFSYQLVDSEGKIISQNILKDQFLNNEQILQYSLKNINTKDFCWNKIYSNQLIKNIEFQSFKCSEDYLFNIKCCLKSYKKQVLPLICYNYRQHESSVGHERFNEKKLDVIRAREYALDNFNINSSDKEIIKVSILDRTYYLIKEAKQVTLNNNLDYLKNVFIKYFNFRGNYRFYTGKLYNRSLKRLFLFLLLNFRNKIERKHIDRI